MVVFYTLMKKLILKKTICIFKTQKQHFFVNVKVECAQICVQIERVKVESQLKKKDFSNVQIPENL